MYITGKAGGIAGILYSVYPDSNSEHDLLMAELSKIQILLVRQEYEHALPRINEFVNAHLDFPEAQYV